MRDTPSQNDRPAWLEHDYGRCLDDLVPGDEYRHPFEITVDAGLIGPYSASFMDACPMWSSDRYARAYHLASRPVSPHLAFNLALSMSVHDVSQQGIAHMAYVHVRFPKPLYAGTTVNAVSRVIGARPSGGKTRGVAHIHTVLLDDHRERVVDLERLALVRPGRLTKRPGSPQLRADDVEGKAWMGRLPSVEAATQISNAIPSSLRFDPPLFGCFEDLTPGKVFAHAGGRTIGESEPMQLATLLRNTHPMHVDELYCRREGPTPTRMVYGGLVMAWVVTLASVDLGGHLLWDVVWKEGAHPGFVTAGDTLYAATKVLEADVVNERVGLVKLRHVGVKNIRPSELLEAGSDLFVPELGKPAEVRIAAKVFEITRTILVRRFGK